MKKLYAYKLDCGRMGEVEGLFVAEEAIIMAALGRTVYFGEILGKHSEIVADLDINHLTVKSEDPEFILKLVEIIGSEHISGYNPLDYIEEEE